MNNRSIWKGPFVERKLLKKAKYIKLNNTHKSIKTWSRKSTVIPDFIGLNFSVHNGKKFVQIFVTESMIGKKLGEFALTRKFIGHIISKKK